MIQLRLFLLMAYVPYQLLGDSDTTDNEDETFNMLKPFLENNTEMDYFIEEDGSDKFTAFRLNHESKIPSIKSIDILPKEIKPHFTIAAMIKPESTGYIFAVETINQDIYRPFGLQLIAFNAAKVKVVLHYSNSSYEENKITFMLAKEDILNQWNKIYLVVGEDYVTLSIGDCEISETITRDNEGISIDDHSTFYLGQAPTFHDTKLKGVYQELKLHLSTDIVNCDYGSGEGDIEVFTSTTAELPPLLSSSQQDTGGTNSDGYPENNQCSCTAKDISQLIANMPEMKGNQGEKGIQGIPGEKGLPGMKGDKGIPGTKGAKGDTGEHGIKGSNGLKGDRGLPGLDGKTGENGVKGDIGPAGPPGPSGPAGATVDYVIPPSEGNQQNSGIKGDKGDKGSTGSHGRGGSAGPPGSRGPPGFKGDKGWLGPPGEQGDKGDKGDSYVASLDALKFKGEKGDRGQDGLPGKEGLQGPPGPPGHYLSLSGPPGPPGPPGMTRLADEFMYPERDNCKHSRGTEETEEGMKFNTVIYKSTKSLLRNSRMIQTGTLAFVVEEESLLLRVKKGWQYIPMGSLLPLEMEDISTPRVPSPRPSHIKPLSPIDGEDAIRMVALNEPVTGDLRGFKSADFACYRDSYKAGLKGTYRAFLASRYQNIDTVVPLSAHERPVVNLRGEKLFDSWSQMFKGSGAMFQHSPRLYSFNGRNVHTHPTWPNKAVWHGATESGERAMESYCDSWHSSSPEKQGLASLISSNKLLDQNTFSCNTELILLCVDIPAHSSQKTRRKKRFTRSEEDRRLLHFRNADEYARHLVELHVTTNRTL